MEKAIKVGNEIIQFDLFDLSISNRNQENIFIGNNRTLGYKLDKAINNYKDRLHSLASQHKVKYMLCLTMKLGDFLLKLKKEGNPDYLLYLNKYGDSKFCTYSIPNYRKDKGIYCYIIEDKIVYVGRSKKTFFRRFEEYGNITPYNCLIDGQATNCNINSKVNKSKSIKVGFFLMNNSSDKEIENLEKSIIYSLKLTHNLWNIQQNTKVDNSSKDSNKAKEIEKDNETTGSSLGQISNDSQKIKMDNEFALTLGQTYWTQGFFNVPVSHSYLVANDNATVQLLLGEKKEIIHGTINRRANKSGNPRVMGGVSLRDWIQSTFKKNETVKVRIVSPSSLWLKKV